jgi:rubrerythrin
MHHHPPRRPGRKKKTAPLAPLLKQTIRIWECPNCGQSYFGENPPDLCDYCQDFTTWRLSENPREAD